MYSKVKALGHPIHPMLVAFPVAFYTTTCAAFIVYAVSRNVFWFQLASVANWGGVISAVVAAIPGFIDWSMGIPKRTHAKAHGLKHMVLNLLALTAFTVSGVIQIGQWGEPAPSATAGVVLSLVGLGLTVPAGFFGWSLVQKHHVGVQLTKEQERIEPEQVQPNGHRPRRFRAVDGGKHPASRP